MKFWWIVDTARLGAERAAVEALARDEGWFEFDQWRFHEGKLSAEGVQSVTGRHVQIVKPGHRVDLIEFATHICPELARNSSSRFAVDAVPDVPGRYIGERPDHRIAL